MRSSPFFCKNCGYDIKARFQDPIYRTKYVICNHCNVKNDELEILKHYIPELVIWNDLNGIAERDMLIQYAMLLRRKYDDRILYEACIDEYAGLLVNV